MNLKKINQQTMVITGATSGIGLSTARMAAANGARLVLIARNEDALRQLTDEINSNGGEAIYFAADVADEGALREAAAQAQTRFGGFDTWVNNAGGSIYGRIMDVPTEDLRRLFETNVWGVVNGSKIAVDHLRRRGGALINVGSEVSDAVVPIQGMYSASKHAVKAFTEALRMELEADSQPISVTLIKPTAIHTPFPENAKNYLPYEPQLPPPVYAPELVAEAILHCAENPTPEFFVGETAKLHSTMAKLMPRSSEKMNEMMIDSMQNSGEPARAGRRDGLYESNSNLRERGARERYVLENSLYQKAMLHPVITGALAVGAGLGIAALVSSRQAKNERSGRVRAGGRAALAVNPRWRIREHMEVVGSDGILIGSVDKVEGDQIKLTKSDSTDGQHHRIALGLVDRIDANKVRLRQTATETRRSWLTGGAAAGLDRPATTGDALDETRDTNSLTTDNVASIDSKRRAAGGPGNQ
jgi:short-subunit dehydrogenase